MLRPDGPLVGRLVSVEPLEERHRDGLRAAAEDVSIFRFMAWPGDFDRYFDEALASPDVPFAVCVGGAPAGSTRFLAHVPEHRRVEIGFVNGDEGCDVQYGVFGKAASDGREEDVTRHRREGGVRGYDSGQGGVELAGVVRVGLDHEYGAALGGPAALRLAEVSPADVSPAGLTTHRQRRPGRRGRCAGPSRWR